jgi:hypothetical protein
MMDMLHESVVAKKNVPQLSYSYVEQATEGATTTTVGLAHQWLRQAEPQPQTTQLGRHEVRQTGAHHTHAHSNRNQSV